MLGDALAGVSLAALPVQDAVDDVRGVGAVVAELAQELVVSLGVLRVCTAASGSAVQQIYLDHLPFQLLTRTIPGW